MQNERFLRRDEVLMRALVRADRQLAARKGEAKPVSAFLADAIKEALHATD